MLEESRIYLHGRPSPHPLHKELAMKVCSQNGFIDEAWPWQENKPSAIIWLFAELWNAISFKKYKNYSSFLIDNLHLAPIIARKIGVLKNKELSVHLGSHTLYFLTTKKFNWLNHKIQIWALSNYDRIVCEGKMAKEMVVNLNPNLKEKAIVTYIAPDKERKKRLNQISYNPKSKRIVTVCSGPSEFRKWYKGLDIMVSAMAKVLQVFPSHIFEIAGDWNSETIHDLTSNFDRNIKERIKFVGIVNNIPQFLENSVLYLHISRGDAFPTSTMEAMDAGLPVLLSNVTGTKEFIEEIPELISDINSESAFESIRNFLRFDSEVKTQLSNTCRKKVANHNMETCIKLYQSVFT